MPYRTFTHHVRSLQLGSFGWVVLGFASLSLVLSVVAFSRTALDRPLEPAPFEYVGQGYAGTIGTGGKTVERPVASNGLPVLEAPVLSFVAVRCGPEEPTAVRSLRTWIMTRPDGTRSSIEEPAGIFDFRPVEGCAPLSFTVTVPDAVLARDLGSVILSIDFDLRERSGTREPVGLRSEPFRIGTVDPDYLVEVVLLPETSATLASE